jgi:hypothetical protein
MTISASKAEFIAESGIVPDKKLSIAAKLEIKKLMIAEEPKIRR